MNYYIDLIRQNVEQNLTPWQTAGILTLTAFILGLTLGVYVCRDRNPKPRRKHAPARSAQTPVSYYATGQVYIAPAAPFYGGTGEGQDPY